MIGRRGSKFTPNEKTKTFPKGDIIKYNFLTMFDNGDFSKIQNLYMKEGKILLNEIKSIKKGFMDKKINKFKEMSLEEQKEILLIVMDKSKEKNEGINKLYNTIKK